MESHDQDLRAIRKVVSDLEAQQSDLDGFTQLLTHDAVLINIAGRRVRGRDQIYAAMKAGLATPMAQVLTRHEIEDVRLLRPDVALVSCNKYVDDQRGEGHPVMPAEARMTLVLLKDQDTWLAASLQTTPLPM
jgi:uncharacterized protein (TIGR02246 family)